MTGGYKVKRYWKIFTLGLLTVFIIGFFYIQSGLAAKKDIKVEFEKISGDENEVENIYFYANYEIGDIYQSLQISNKETVDRSQFSLLQSLNRDYSAPVYKKLVEKHKSFMRGKNNMPESFYEDENILAYVDLSNKSERKFSLDIDVLSKKTDERTSIQLEFPEKGKYNWVNVAEVQSINSKLKIFVRGFKPDGSTDILLYTFNIEKQEIEKSEVILSTGEIEKQWSDIRIINDSQSIEYEKYFLFNVETQEVRYEGEPSMEKEGTTVFSNKLVAYDIENGQVKNIEIPEGKNSILDLSSIHGTTLYVPSQMESKYEINQYDLEKEVWGEGVKFNIPASKEGYPSQPYVKIENGKLYMISATKDGYTLLISDATTGKVFYEGLLKVKKDGKIQPNNRLYIHDMETVQ